MTNVSKLRTHNRSHCIFTIYVESRSRVESSEKVLYSKLNLVDLAGSERLSKTETSGISLKEAMCMFFLKVYCTTNKLF